MKPIAIILADDHRIFRDGIKSLLSEVESISIVGEASTGEELLEMLKTTYANIVIMDISMPGITGIEATRQLTLGFPEVKTMILSMHTNEEFIINSVKAGAKAYLPKDTGKEELLEAIKTVSEGGEYFSKSVSDSFLKNFIKRSKIEQSLTEECELTQREIEILKLAASGMSNKEIADKLFISIKTVDAHKNHIMQKLKLKNTAELVLYAIKRKIIEV